MLGAAAALAFLGGPAAAGAATGGRVTGYSVGGDGSLEQITSVPAAAGHTGAAGG